MQLVQSPRQLPMLLMPTPTPSAWASNTKFTRRDKARFGGLFYFASSVSGNSGGGSGALPPHPPAGRFLPSSAQTKRPNSTQPFMPGSQGRSLTRAHLPFCSCGHPQELIVASVDPFFVFTFVCFAVQTHPSELVACVGWAKAEGCAHHSPRGQMKLAHPTPVFLFFFVTFVCFVVQIQQSKLVAPMHRHHAAGQVEVFDALQPCFLHHLFQLFLPRMHADGFGEVAVAVGIASDEFADPGQQLERIGVV